MIPAGLHTGVQLSIRRFQTVTAHSQIQLVVIDSQVVAFLKKRCHIGPNEPFTKLRFLAWSLSSTTQVAAPSYGSLDSGGVATGAEASGRLPSANFSGSATRAGADTGSAGGMEGTSGSADGMAGTPGSWTSSPP